MRFTHPTELADLFGIRLAICEETEDGHSLNESLVKSLTGGGRVRARRMRQDFWEFEATHLPILVTNHKPCVRGSDYGIWRRLRLIPFDVTFAPAQQDKHLRDKLMAELPAIARWMTTGAVEVQQRGLQEPPDVLLATEAYRIDNYTVERWFAECVERASSERLRPMSARASYERWCSESGENPLGAKKFFQSMGERSDRKVQSDGIYYCGLKLSDPTDVGTMEPWIEKVA